MNQPFTVGSTNPILDQPTVDDNYLYARSDAVESGSVNVAVTGLDDTSAPYQETIVLPSGSGKIEVKSAGFISFVRSVNTSAEGDISLYAFGTAGIGALRAETNPADGTTITFGLAGFTRAYRFKDTLALAYDVKREATATDTMLHFKKAINADGVSGTDYFAGTAANPYLSATVSGTIITLTDRIACRRQLGWSFAQSSTHFSLPATLSCGVDGVLIATILSGGSGAFDGFSLGTEDLATPTLPALLTPTTDAIALNGRACMLRFKCNNVVSAIALKYQTSTDNVNWSNGVTSITSIDNNTVLAPQFVTPSERCIEYLRLVFTANANTADSNVDARVIYPI